MSEQLTYEQALAEIERLQGENRELTHIFELQREREKPWIERWRKWTGKHDSLPDYGEMLAWLMMKAEQAERQRVEAQARAVINFDACKSVEDLHIQAVNERDEAQKQLADVDMALLHVVAETERGRKVADWIENYRDMEALLKECYDEIRERAIRSLVEAWAANYDQAAASVDAHSYLLKRIREVLAGTREEKGRVIFQFKGAIYNKPMGNGILFEEGELGAKYIHLEEAFESGHYDAEIVIRERKVQ